MVTGTAMWVKQKLGMELPVALPDKGNGSNKITKEKALEVKNGFQRNNWDWRQKKEKYTFIPLKIVREIELQTYF